MLSHAPSLVRTLSELPTVTLELTAELAGLRIAARYGRPFSRPWTRFARAVLDMPDDAESYLIGRSRHALRSNLHRAAAAGLTCAEVHPEDIPAAVRSVLGARSELDQYADVVTRCRHLATDVFSLIDRSGAVAAITAVDADARCAELELMLQTPEVAGTGGRFLLHTHVVRELIGRGVQRLLAGSTLQLAPGHQYFQRRVGYEPMNVRLRLITRHRRSLLRPQDAEVLAVASRLTRARAGGRSRA